MNRNPEQLTDVTGGIDTQRQKVEVDFLSPGIEYPPEQLQEIIDVFKDAFPYGVYLPDVEADLLGRYATPEQIQEQIDHGSTWLVARGLEGTPAGILRLGEKSPGQFHIFWVMTKPESRKQGVAEHLINVCEQSLLVSGKLAVLTASIHPENAASMNLFVNKLGFRQCTPEELDKIDVNTHADYLDHFIKVV
jgi:RimJ/RimL family protein N-acetyltransferase